MKGSGAVLVLLFCLSGAVANPVEERESNVEPGTPTPPGIEAELKELRHLVTSMEARLAASEGEAKEQKNLVTDLQAELSFTKNEMEEMSVKLEDLQTKLNDGENEGEDLAEEEERKVDLDQLSTTELWRNASDNQLKRQKRQTRGIPMVAFSGALRKGQVGPNTGENILVYSDVKVNIGSAYDPFTGIFQVPVRGLYYITFTASHNIQYYVVAIKLYRNDQILMYNCGSVYGENGAYEYVSNSIIVLLEVGEKVYMSLPSGNMLYQNYNDNMFNAFLLYAM